MWPGVWTNALSARPPRGPVGTLELTRLGMWKGEGQAGACPGRVHGCSPLRCRLVWESSVVTFPGRSGPRPLPLSVWPPLSSRENLPLAILWAGRLPSRPSGGVPSCPALGAGPLGDETPSPATGASREAGFQDAVVGSRPLRAPASWRCCWRPHPPASLQLTKYLGLQWLPFSPPAAAGAQGRLCLGAVSPSCVNTAVEEDRLAGLHFHPLLVSVYVTEWLAAASKGCPHPPTCRPITLSTVRSGGEARPAQLERIIKPTYSGLASVSHAYPPPTQTYAARQKWPFHGKAGRKPQPRVKGPPV